MEQLCKDKKHLIIMLLELCAVLFYTLCVYRFQKGAIFISWIVSIAAFLGGSIYNIIKKHWITTSVHLAFAIITFLSLMVIAYPI